MGITLIETEAKIAPQFLDPNSFFEVQKTRLHGL